MTASAAPDLPCPCGGQRHYERRPHGRTLQTRVGRVSLPPRARYRCDTCHQRGYPIDEALQLPPGRQMSPMLEEQCGFLATLMSSGRASEVFAYLVGGAVCPSQIWQAVQRLGVQEEPAQHEAYEVLPSQPDPVPATTGHQYVGADGVMYCSRDQTAEGAYQWHELKTAAISDAHAVPVSERHRAAEIRRHQGDSTLPAIDQAQIITSAASARSWEDLGHQAQGERDQRGPQQERIALGDGAESVQSFFATYARAPGVRLTRILDMRHAEQHLWEVAAQLPETNQRLWVDTALLHWERGEATALGQYLSQAASHWADRPEGVPLATRAAAYLTRHAAHIDSLGFIDRHGQIGSGVAESTGKRFGTDRMKGTGMRWSKEGAHHLAILRAKVLNHRWPAYDLVAC